GWDGLVVLLSAFDSRRWRIAIPEPPSFTIAPILIFHAGFVAVHRGLLGRGYGFGVVRQNKDPERAHRDTGTDEARTTSVARTSCQETGFHWDASLVCGVRPSRQWLNF